MEEIREDKDEKWMSSSNWDIVDNPREFVRYYMLFMILNMCVVLGATSCK